MLTQERVIRERERGRILRSLRILFGAKPVYGFQFTDKETSFTDGKVIWVKYDPQTKEHRPFTEGEIRILRLAFAIHERGHCEFDTLEDWAGWRQAYSSASREDWKANKKYPSNWLDYMGNMGMDGRMENLTALKIPQRKEYIDFCNYEWRFGIRDSGAGLDRTQDFMDMYASRVLGMTDLDNWLEEAVELVDSVQTIIEEIRFAESTKACLEKVTELIQTVWPTLYTWMELDKVEADKKEPRGKTHDTESSQWGSKQQAEANSKKVLSGPRPPSNPQKPDFKRLKGKEEQEAQKTAKEAIEALRQHVKQALQANGGTEIIMSPVENTDIEQFYELFSQVQSEIKPVSRTLQELLEGTKDRIRSNQRSGRLKAGRVWKALHADDPNVFIKKQRGTPSKNARISLMTDISASTGFDLDGRSTIIDEMKKAMILLLEACQEVQIPCTAHAFTSVFDEEAYQKENVYKVDPHLFPLKPDSRSFSDLERGMIGGIRSDGGNYDVPYIKWAIEELRKHDENIRLLIMLSDGSPNFNAGEGPEDIRNMVQEAEKEGIDVLCLFIGNHSESTISSVQYMYPGKTITVSNNVARSLQKHVKRIIRLRK